MAGRSSTVRPTFSDSRPYSPFVVDVVAPAPSEAAVNARYIYADLKDYGQVLGLLTDVDSGYRGIDAIIHLAAIPAPGKAVSHLLSISCPD